jgi:hypothetical protein
VIYVYAIVDDLADVSGVLGIAGESLALASVDDVQVVASSLDTAPAITRETLSAQDRVVRALHDRAAALLPMRFGSWFASLEDTQRAVALHAAGLRDRLDRVRHRDQMTVRVAFTQQAHAADSGRSGADYLRERARPTELAPLLEPLSTLVRATMVERGRTPGLITVYHLVDRGANVTYREVVERAARETRGLTVHVSGPSPCYAFT